MTFHIASGIILIIFSIILIKKKRLLSQNDKKAQYLLKGSKPFTTKIAEGFVLFTNYPFIIVWALFTIGFFDHILIEKHIIFGILGILFMLGGIIVYGISVFQLGIKWRVGIDYDDNDYFVTKGLYQWSRHPAYFGFYLLFVGIMLQYATIFSIVLGVLSRVALITMAVEEEKYLRFRFKDQYLMYQKRVHFLIGKKRVL
jgi:protein-S-isoprenylcysteine O-methyltransferase Ste14